QAWQRRSAVLPGRGTKWGKRVRLPRGSRRDGATSASTAATRAHAPCSRSTRPPRERPGTNRGARGSGWKPSFSLVGQAELLEVQLRVRIAAVGEELVQEIAQEAGV